MSRKPHRSSAQPADIDMEAAREQAGPDAGDSPTGQVAPEGTAAAVDYKALADENWDKYLRAVAEAENVRKRAERDIDNARKYALERFCTDLLAVCDSLDMGLAAAGQADAETLREGSEATRKLLASTLAQHGVTEIDPLGQPFDPHLHEAMTMQPSEEVEPGSVLSVFQKGYLLNGRLLRPARVILAAAPVEAADNG